MEKHRLPRAKKTRQLSSHNLSCAMLLPRSLPTLLLHRACIVAAAAEGHCGAELLEGSSLIPPSRLIVMFSHGCSGSSWVPAV